MSRSDAWVTQSSEREGWGRCGSLQTSAGEPGELTMNPVHRRHYWPRAVSLCSPDQNLLRLPTPRMDDPGTRVAPGNRMACALPRPCVTGLLSPCPPIFPLCPSLSLLHAPGLCCSSHLPRPGQARGHCYAWSVMPGVFFPRVLQPLGGGGLLRCHLLGWALPTACIPTITLSLFSIPLESRCHSLGHKTLAGFWCSGSSFGERMGHASHFDLMATP